MRVNYLFWGKVLFQILLLTLFFCFFGLESLKRYWKYEVVELHSEKRLDGLPVPAVTFCPQNPHTELGFKKNRTDLEAVLNGALLDVYCKNKTELKICIEDETFDLNTVVRSVSSKLYETDQEVDHSLWVPHFSYTVFGLCYTYNSSLKLGSDYRTGSIYFGLNADLEYIIFVHDPNIFLLNFNPNLPMNQISYDAKHWQMRRMEVVQHEKLNVPTKPCNTDPDYSFTGCVRKTLSSYVGCRLPWDQWTPTGVPLCTTMDQFR